MRYAFIIGFVLMIVAQWFAPLSMIVGANKTIEGGTEYKFRTQPVDPIDPFRGKYITLTFNEEFYVPLDTNERRLPDYSTVYAVLGTDSIGYARIMQLRAERPTENLDYIEVQRLYSYGSTEPMSLKFPFSRFYLEESKATTAEQIYWQSRNDSATVCYAKVKVMDGDAKLTDVILNDSSIVDVVKRFNKGKED